MKKIFSILFALVLVVSLGLVTATLVLADTSPGWRDIDQVAAGGYFMVGLKDEGTVVAVGLNDYGQCNVDDWTDITQVAAGWQHTVGLKSDGIVVAMGDNDDGQCNVGNWTDIIQVAAGHYHTVGRKSDGTVVAVGDNYEEQCNVDGWMDIIQVAAGDLHTVGRKSDGTVVTVGDNDFGQCDVDGWTDIIQIAAGGDHTVGLKGDGTVVAVGLNDDRQCDVDGWTDIIQVAAGFAHTVGRKSDGTVVAVGQNDDEQCDVGGWTDIVQVAAGSFFTVGLKSDSTVVAVGDNDYGQCGRGVTETVTDNSVNARDEADTEVAVNGTATVTVAQYADNPHPPSIWGGYSQPSDFAELGKYIDVYVPDTTEITGLEIRLYYTDAEVATANVSEESLRLFWWNEPAWVQCSNSGVNTTRDYIWAIIKEDTMPSLSDLQGTEFGGYGHPSTPPQGICFIATAAYGTDRAKELDILREFRDEVLLPNSLGARFVSLYYKTSPPVAHFISQHEVLKAAVRVGFVDPIVKILNWSHDLWSAQGSGA